MSKTAFISGHRDATQEEFDLYYKPSIDAFLVDGWHFVVGDCDGIDIMAQRYLGKLEYGKVTVYHIGSFPMNFGHMNFNLKGRYASDEDRDSAMTIISDVDIAWVRKGKEHSGTAQNLYRRMLK